MTSAGHSAARIEGDKLINLHSQDPPIGGFWAPVASRKHLLEGAGSFMLFYLRQMHLFHLVGGHQAPRFRTCSFKKLVWARGVPRLICGEDHELNLESVSQEQLGDLSNLGDRSDLNPQEAH